MRDIKGRLRSFFRSAAEEALGAHIAEIAMPREGDATPVNLARLLALANESRDLPHLRDYSFRTYSQFGEDGVIQHLLSRVAVPNDRFVEIGVQDYSESNTRLLTLKDNWRGLLIDSGPEAGEFLFRTGLDVRRAIDFRQAFVTAENVNDLLGDVPPEIGLLSIDIDGMDYWVWKALEVVRPTIVVIEFQNTFGPSEELVVPYNPEFDRMRAHPTGLYWGASLAALERLGAAKGYVLVGTSDGPNAFFISEDRIGNLSRVTAAECYIEARYRESREGGRSPFVTEISERCRAIADREVLDLRTNERRTIGEIESLFAQQRGDR